jgi:excisionase family DNA binding protein
MIDRLAYSPAEIAAAAGLSRKAIYRAIASGELQASKVCGGSRFLIQAGAARDWLDANLVQPEAGTRFDRSRIQGRRQPGRPLRDAMEGFGGPAGGVYDEPVAGEGDSP